ncbi:MAG TPA: AMP-binding protein, partial [Terriglobales bacterium]|nr:AMP-binding protein [Terriglobales bacterium]
MIELNLADCLDAVAEINADAEALIQGDRHFRWAEVEQRANNVATWMKRCGVSHGGKVAVYTYNHPAYMEGCYAAMKAALVPVNVNYRYREEELRYLLDNADAEAVIVHQEFVPILARVAPSLPQLRAVLVVGDGKADLGSLPSAEAYEDVATRSADQLAVKRSPDDLLFLYTGGTTGMPKGVMWRQADLYRRLAGGGLFPPPPDMEAFRAFAANPPIRMRTLIGPPLMHGTGWFTAIIAWLGGGTVILMEDPTHFDAAALFRTVARTKPTTITIVGDSFAKPMLREL